jgi:hypothetical protein
MVTRRKFVPHPHPNLPSEGEGDFSVFSEEVIFHLPAGKAIIFPSPSGGGKGWGWVIKSCSMVILLLSLKAPDIKREAGWS